MNLVRLKIEESNFKNKFLLMIVLFLVLIVLILVFNPFWNIRTKLECKKIESMNRTPAYESLKTIKLTGEKKYSLPVNFGKATVNNDNTITINADSGTRVKSIGDGMISCIGQDLVYGNYIEVVHSRLNEEDLYAFYGNLDKPITGEIIVVQKGQKLGEVGSKGCMHFEIRDKNHKVVNPYKYMNLE